MTPIVVPHFVKDAPSAISFMRSAAEGGATMVELRCDTASLQMLAETLLARESARVDGARMPVIVTVRPTWEGGFYAGDDRERFAFFRQAIAAGAEYIDVELLAWQRFTEARALPEAIRNAGGKTQLILSNHCFDGRPADLLERLAQLRQVPEAQVLKLAWKAESLVDAVDALRLTAANRTADGRPLLALAMGEMGQISRLLGAKFGSPFTFATLARGAESAPGQPTVGELKNLYRWGSQQAGSTICGVIGWPVGHSLSPLIHNAGFTSVGFDGVYVPLAIPPEYAAFAASVDALRACPGMNLKGLSVTIPHKENAIRYVRERGGSVEALSEHIGVINTIVFNGLEQPPAGLNSDYPGALDALVEAMGIPREGLAGRRVAMIGAGGAARAIVAGLAAYGATTVVYNRNLARAQELAAEFNGKTGKVVPASLEKLCDSCCEVYINCTPLGMHPKVDASPVEQEPRWGSETVVFDTVYNPLHTKLLQQALAAGAKVVPGMEMFIGQAVVQFRAFTGHEPPVGVWRKLLREKLLTR